MTTEYIFPGDAIAQTLQELEAVLKRTSAVSDGDKAAALDAVDALKAKLEKNGGKS